MPKYDFIGKIVLHRKFFVTVDAATYEEAVQKAQDEMTNGSIEEYGDLEEDGRELTDVRVIGRW